MTSRYRKSLPRRSRASSRARPSFGWLTLLCGILLGMIIVLLIYERSLSTALISMFSSKELRQGSGTLTKPSYQASVVGPQVPSAYPPTATSLHAMPAGSSGLNQRQAGSATAKKGQSFEFYKILPEGHSKTALKKTNTASQAFDPIASQSQYILEVGIFRNFGQADSLKARLALAGYRTHIQKVMTEKGETWFRVSLGPYGSEALALSQKKRLSDLKIRGIVIQVS